MPSPVGSNGRASARPTLCFKRSSVFLAAFAALLLLWSSGALAAQRQAGDKPPMAKRLAVMRYQRNQGHGHHLTVTGTMPSASVGTPFNAVVTATGGQSPYAFAIIWQTLPPGLSLDSMTGAITGTPTTRGSYQFSVSAGDLAGDAGDHRFTISVEPGGSQTVTVSVTPVAVNVAPGGTQQFTATVRGTEKTAVTWTASAGSVSNTGLFTAPIPPGTQTVFVTATS